MLVMCQSCEEEFEVDETKLPPKKVKSKCLKCGAWIYLRGDDGQPSSLVEPPDLTEGIHLLEKGNYQKAQDFFQGLLEKNPSDSLKSAVVDQYLVWASEKASSGEAQSAQDCVETALEILSDSPELWGLSGAILTDLCQLEPAKKAFQKALSFDPKDEKYYIGLAGIFKQLRRPDEEANIYKKALKVLKKNSLLYLKLSQALFYSGDYGGTLQALKTALNLDKNNKGAKRFFNKAGAIKEFARGVGFFKKKKYKEAMAVFQKVQSPLKSYSLFHYYQGVCHYMLRQFGEAIGALEKHLHLDAHGLKTSTAISFLQRAIKELQDMEIKVILQPMDQCHLIITSVPARGTIFLDDKNLGQAPQDLTGISAGSHILKAELNGSELEIPLIFSGGISYKIAMNLSQKDFTMEPSLDYEVVQK